MGFSNNPLVSWREFDKALSWGKHGDLTLKAPPAEPARPVKRAQAAVRYAELHVHSDFSLQQLERERELTAFLRRAVAELSVELENIRREQQEAADEAVVPFPGSRRAPRPLSR